MAATPHLSRWIQRNQTRAADLEGIASDRTRPRHPERTMGAARATYLWLPQGTNLWLRDWDYELLERTTLTALLA
jgi:hypothetical protein